MLNRAPETVRQEVLGHLSLGAFGYWSRCCGRAACRFKVFLSNIFANDRISKESAGASGQPFKYKTIPQGAATSVWAGLVAPADEVGGRYCENCHASQVVPADTPLTVNSEGVRAYALDPKSAEALWRKSEELVGEHF